MKVDDAGHKPSNPLPQGGLDSMGGGWQDALVHA